MNATRKGIPGLPPVPPAALCERLIGLYGRDDAPGWWRALQDSARPLFGPDSRYREAPLEACGPEVEAAVAAGWRPVLFVPRAAEWPAVYDQLGRFQTVARLCVRGRHDGAMRRLLHEPSAEVLEAAAAEGGSILVPDRDYGQALDGFLATVLEDFRLEHAAAQPQPDQTRQVYAFVSRLNPYRRLRLVLERDAAVASLRQELRQEYVYDDPQQAPEPCDAPIDFAGSPLRFERGGCPLEADRVAGIAAALRLPEREQTFCSLLVTLLTASRTRALSYFSKQWQSRIADLAGSAEQLERIVRWVVTGPPLKRARATRGAIRRRGGAGPAAVLVTGTEVADGNVVVRLAWVPQGSPDPLPTVSLEVNGRPVDLEAGKVEWAADRSSISITLSDGQTAAFAVAWRWDQPAGKLHLALRQDEGRPAAAGHRAAPDDAAG